MFFSIVLLGVLLNGCANQINIAPTEKYKNFNDTVEKYFLSTVSEDFYQMKQMVSGEVLTESIQLQEAKEGDSPHDPQMLEEMGDRYSITGFDYFYEEHGEIYYLVEYYNFRSGNEKSPLIFAVKKEGDDYVLMNGFGRYIAYSKFGSTIKPSDLKKAIEENPEHVFVVKDYPEK